MEKRLCDLIKELKKEDNNVIVFNKNEDKPDPKTIKKRKKARCMKLIGDLYLNLHLVEEAYKQFKEAE